MQNQDLDNLAGHSRELVLAIDGEHKFKSLLLAADGLFFISKSGLASPGEFRDAYEKSGLKDLLTKKDHKTWDKVKNVRWKRGTTEVNVAFTGALSADVALDFSDTPGGAEAMLEYLEKAQKFRRSEAQLTPFKAALPNIGWFIGGIVITGFLYNIATSPEAAADVYESQGRRRGLVKLAAHVAEALGPIGVLAVGLLGCGYAGYRVWQKFKNPPVEVRLEP